MFGMEDDAKREKYVLFNNLLEVTSTATGANVKFQGNKCVKTNVVNVEWTRNSWNGALIFIGSGDM
jgi:hypothetical protein